MSKINITIRPLSRFDERENVANSQFWLCGNGTLFVRYDEDDDEDPNALYDVTNRYEVTVATDLEATPSDHAKAKPESKASPEIKRKYRGK